jgi:hypothetical protein
MATYDEYRDSINIERTLLSDTYVEGKNEGKSERINQMIDNGYKADISNKILSVKTKISTAEVKAILNKPNLTETGDHKEEPNFAEPLLKVNNYS